MLSAFAVAAVLGLHLQIQAGVSQRRAPTVRDSTAADSSGKGRNRGIAQALTAEPLASAFKDATARISPNKARAARMQQDSALKSYDAMSYQRISAGMGFTKLGRDRLIFRHESAARVRWQDKVGVWVDVKGARAAVPMIG